MDSLYYFIIPLGFLMGVVSSISGGGGVFGVPALIALGLSPVNALALNRISDLGHIVGCMKNYVKAEGVDKRLVLLSVPPILIGAYIGANFVVGLEDETLNAIIIGAVLVGAFLLLYPFKKKAQAGKPNLILGAVFLLLLGLWDGAFAMAGGTFGVLIFVLIFHKSYVNAKGILTIAVVPETLMSVTILFVHSSVSYGLCGAMFASSLVGAYVGSKLAVKKGSEFIRYAMVGMALIMVAKIILFDVLAIAG